MKKIFFVAFMLLLSFILCFPIAKPKNDKIGALIGKTYLELDKDWENMRAGKYFKVEMEMFNKSTKKKFTAMGNKDGIFYFLNLEPGEYVLTGINYEYQAGNTIYTVGGYFGKTGYDVVINSNKITALKTIAFQKEVLPRDERRDNVSSTSKLQRMDQKIVREENLDELKDFFTKLDNRNQWANFEWIYEDN